MQNKEELEAQMADVWLMYPELKEYSSCLADALYEYRDDYFTVKKIASRVAELLDPEDHLMPRQEWLLWKSVVRGHLNTLSLMGILEKRRIRLSNEYKLKIISYEVH
jgi:hypothetical protein